VLIHHTKERKCMESAKSALLKCYSPILLIFSQRTGQAVGLAVLLFIAVTTVGQARKTTSTVTLTLAGGGSHTCILVDGVVRCWGYLAAVGAPRTTDRPVPVAVSGLPAGIRQISASSQHTCALTPTGGVKCWGLNESGQIGDGTRDFRQTPVDVIGLSSPVQSLGLGFSHSCVVLDNTNVQCWGLNANYQLGADVGNVSETPVSVAGLSGVSKVAGGGAHTCALLNSGALKCWGYNYYGSLGNGANEDTFVPQDVVGLDHSVIDVVAGYLSTCALLEGGQVKCWGLLLDIFSNTPVAVAGLESGVTHLAMGSDHLCTLHTGGQVRCVGSNDAGQLGDGTNDGRNIPAVVPGLESGVTVLAAGLSHNCGATASGQVWCWGADGSGQLGIGTTTSAGRPWPVVALSGQTMSGVSSGSNYVCGYTAGGALYCWGLNNSGNLGVAGATYGSFSLPLAVTGLSSGTTQVSAGTHTCAVVNGAAFCWGRNDVGQLGNGTRITADTPSPVSGLVSGVSEVAVTPGADQDHTCAIVNGGAFCWGGNFVGQLGNGESGVVDGVTTPQAVVGLSSGVSDIAAGGYHSCAVVNGAALCWGSAYYGQLGNGVSGAYTYPSPVPVNNLSSGVTAVTAGREFSCAVVDGAAKCWGRNNAGQLGDGSTTDRSIANQVSGLTSGVTAITAGDDRACALAGGEVWCWGGVTGSGSAPAKVIGLSGVTKLTASYTSCALNAQGLSCWGNNYYGQMGDGRTFQSNHPVRVLGFGPQPELRINFDQAASGSPLRLVGANFPPNATILLKSNGQSFCTLTNGPDGFFPAVLLTGGAPDGYYEISALSMGVEAAAGLRLEAGSPLHQMEGGGPICALPGAAVPTPAPTPTTPPGTSLPVPVVEGMLPAAGDASLVGQVEIYGKNFQPGAVARLGDIPAIQTSFNDSTHLTALLPGGLAAGVYDLSVINPNWSKGTLSAAYTAMIIDPVSPEVQDDLYGENYELTSANLYETVGEPTQVWFTIRRLGGATTLNNITVRFYVGALGLSDPASQASLIGEETLSGLAANRWLVASVNWTPAQAGRQELYTVIDPQDTIEEQDEDNNLYHSWVEVRPPQVVDNIPPVVTSVSAPYVVSQSYVELEVQATDAGGSGVAWVDLVVWEYFPSARAWLMTDETGWKRFNDGSTNHFWYWMSSFSGPRFIDVWAADEQNNVSQQPVSVLVNYIEPDNFIFLGESHLFLFPLQTGDVLSADLTNLYSLDDADLYLWPPDYPSRDYWYSANDAGLPESLAVVAPLDGYYWLEVYGYDFAFYNLVANWSPGAALYKPLNILNGVNAKVLRDQPLAAADNLPVQTYRLTWIASRVFLPIIKR
jgi:alpha-tubulin suppressor-like RCC1 family protein